ncbi:MAG: hypothetical protein AB8B81_20130 [Halioglobus sp.]
MRTLAIVLLIPFTILTLYAVSDVGYIGIFDYHRHSSAGWQVFADLVVALILVMCWMVKDAKANGRSVWPWIAVTLTLGSIGPLLYLALRPKENLDLATPA